ncbi:hypothetical protein PG993_000119 [Apiospora rasikravindrae]|uniref:Uncharacterized protein n=1 Tax=Apiospora rasikravindrae TaxID=990691 RepID=A0ABR1U845_9PEZI
MGLDALKKASDALSQAKLNNYVNDAYDWPRGIIMVTGGSGGIGAPPVRKFAELEATVVSVDIVPPKEPLPPNAHFLHPRQPRRRLQQSLSPRNPRRRHHPHLPHQHHPRRPVSSATHTVLEPEVVADAVFQHILTGNSGRLFFPGYMSVMAGLRGWPAWLQEKGQG